MKLITRHPFLTYGLIALLIHAFIFVSGAQYDDGGLGSLLIISAPFWAVIYWAPSEFIFFINNGVAVKGQEAISVIVGLGLCVLADYLLNIYKSRNSEELVNT